MALDAHSFVIFLRFRKYNAELTPSNKVHPQRMLITEPIQKLLSFVEPCTVSPYPVFFSYHNDARSNKHQILYSDT